MLLVLSGCSFGVQTHPAGDKAPWKTHLYNEKRANANPDPFTIPPTAYWRKDISPIELFRAYPPEQLSSPAVSEGVVFVGSTNGNFYAFDLIKGKVLWSFDAGYQVESSPTVHEGRVFFGTSEGVFFSLKVKDGKELWRFQARSEIPSSPLILDGKVVFTSSDNRTHALDSASGEKLWSYSRVTVQTVTPRFLSSPAGSGNLVFQLYNDGYLVCLAADSGRELWRRQVLKAAPAGLARRTPLVHNGSVFIADSTGSILALDEITGEVKGIYNPLKVIDYIIPERDTMVIASTDEVVSVNIRTGAQIWKRELNYKPATAVFSAGEYVFILSNHTTKTFGLGYLARTNGYIQALSIRDGEIKWVRRLKSSITSNASAGENHISLLTNRGRVEVFGSR